LSVDNGFHLFKASINLITAVDQDLTTNSDSITFQTNKTPVIINFSLTTDDYGNETSWKIFDINTQALLFQGGPYASVRGGKTYSETLCLYDSCFTLKLFDSAADGFTGIYGNGNVKITSALNDTLLFVPSFSNISRSDNFCSSDTLTSISTFNHKTNIKVFPNPINRGSVLRIQNLNYNKSQVELFDMTGRKINTSIATEGVRISSDTDKGIYFVKIIDNANQVIFLEKIIVQ
jgi:hypothetical protein